LDKYIKTQCGIEKYHQLKAKTGILNSVRFYWFVVLASIRDTLASKKQQTLKTIVIFEVLVASATFNLDVNSSKYINSNYLVFTETME
jgi:hypothetical protein